MAVDSATMPAGDGLRPLASPDLTLMRWLDRVCGQAGAARASLFLRDPMTGEAVTRVAHLDEVEEIRLSAGRGIVGAVMASAQVHTWPGTGPEPDPATLDITGYRPTSILAVPVYLGKHVVGVVELLDGPLGPDVVRRAERIAERIAKVLAESSLAAQLRPRGELPPRLEYVAEGIVGGASSLRGAFHRVALVAPTQASVLIIGETGTGKELFARAIHANSSCAEGPLVKVDCGALPDSILENELFGHEKGAFTGAGSSTPGRFEEAHGGTLFLDEVGELSGKAQTRLLRVLEDRVVQRLGGGRPRTVDFRLVSATHRDLVAMARRGEFRTDLLHRIQVVRVRLPPLRERGAGDIMRLVEHFAELHGRRHSRPVRRIPRTSQDLLARHPWFGNVRELSHAVESAVVLTTDGVLVPELFELESTQVEGGGSEDRHPFHQMPTVAELEGQYLTWLMEHFEGRKAEVAQVAGIGRTTLWRKLKEIGLDP
ncbi:MAG: sigma-54-dependent Fis family transcriptional regulator [Oligoflexia bacterium]|nr:sigma-54-dependent Fis family transcriptional regulator [Oligoflexia bacterium]